MAGEGKTKKTNSFFFRGYIPHCSRNSVAVTLTQGKVGCFPFVNVLRKETLMKRTALLLWTTGIFLFGSLSFSSATTTELGLDFFAPERSLWGGGLPAGHFGTSGSLSLGAVDLFSYDIGASMGSVSGQFKGNLNLQYSDTLTSPGTTSIGLGFLGSPGGGLVKSDLGAWVNVTALYIPIIDYDYGLNIAMNFVPQIGQTFSGSDDVPVYGKSVDVLVAEAGAQFQIGQTDEFKVTALQGNLSYWLKDTATIYEKPFSLTGNDLSLDVNLPSKGIWEFGFNDLTLNNQFDMSFDINLLLYEEHFSWDLDWHRNEKELFALTVYDADPFPLPFNEIDNISAFQIYVGDGPGPEPVPEPTTMLLLGSGLIGLAGYGRKKFFRK